MLSILQFCIRFILALGIKLGIAFMVMCTALVIICIFCGDIKINIVRSETEKENRQEK